MKRKLLAGAVLALCLSLLSTGTLAYFAAEETAHNVITSGGVDIDLMEWADEDKTTPFPADGVRGAMPGCAVVKIVEIKNTGASPAYVRVKVEKSIALAQGAAVEPDPNLLSLAIDPAHWLPGGDGYYYYREALAPGAVTERLLASVEFDAAMGNAYQNCTATVDVTAYAVQAANNGATALEAQGWPEA
jgi:predicted ribosomally synthesized peptide with SipW-like signal peptide